MTNLAKPSDRSRPFSGVAGHASTVAMTGARSLTSHARRRYYDRYSGKYRFAPLVYLFDVFLVCVALGLLIFDLFWFLHATFVSTPGLAVSFQAPPIVASEAVPLLAEIRSSDGRVHEGVQLRWDLPDWVEIVRSEPPANEHGLIFLGTVRPNDPRTVRLIVRVRASVGDEVPVSVSIRQLDPLGSERYLSGTEVREVKDASLSLKPLIEARRVVSGAAIPYVIENTANLPVEAVRVRLVRSEGATEAKFEGGSTEATIGRLNPSEQRLIWLNLGAVSSEKVALELELLDGPQAVSVLLEEYTRSTDELAVRLLAPLDQTSSSAEARVSASGAGSVLIQHPAGEFGNGHAYGIFPIESGERRISVPLTAGATPSRWSAVAISGVGESAVIGRSLTSLVGIPMTTAARFYSISGDQIGVGPNPPLVGQTTRYWIAWTLGPLAGELANVKLSAQLPLGVLATGNFVSPIDAASFTSDGSSVSWNVSSLSLTGDSLATFAFEVMLTPTDEQAGSVLPLVGTVTLGATDVASQSDLQITKEGDDTRLRFDERASSDGVVRR
ncbi:hypothetical protein KBC59_04260 [Patescibacteria group bacterium]|jgi:hypothetical protein|nr:hypothetical protein [Patescibacteria group bacterium]